MKTDYKKELGTVFSPKQGVIETVIVPAMQFLMVDGRGNPNTSSKFKGAIETLYPVAYTLKFICKKELDEDFTVMPLEGLWWASDPDSFMKGDKDSWQWTVMIMQPRCVTEPLFERAVQEVREKKNPPAIANIRLEAYNEGRAAQTLYVGPYANEGPTIQRIHEYIAEQGGHISRTTKHHHEIYLGDPRRTDPSGLKTIIRQPY